MWYRLMNEQTDQWSSIGNKKTEKQTQVLMGLQHYDKKDNISNHRCKNELLSKWYWDH